MIKKFRFSAIAEWALFYGIVLAVLVFIVWPVVAVIRESIIVDGTVTWRLFARIMPVNTRMFANSLFSALAATALALAIALPVALYERYARFRFKKLISPLLLITMISPPFVSALAYIVLFGKRGLVTYGLLGLKLDPYGWQGVVIMQALGEISFAALVLIAALRVMDFRLLQASRDLGASVNSTLGRVVLPLLVPGLGAAGFLCFIKSLADFGTPMIIGGNFSTLATEAYMAVIAKGDLGSSAVLSIMLFVPAAIALFVYRKTGGRTSQPGIGSAGFPASETPLELRGWLSGLCFATTLLFAMVMLAQFITIILAAVTVYNGSGYEFTGEYLRALSADRWLCVLRSVWYAVVAGICASVIGVYLAYYIERRNICCKSVLSLALSLPYIIPGTLFGIGYVLAFNKAPLDITGTTFIVIVNSIFRSLTVGEQTGAAALTNVSRDLENAALDLGASRLRVLSDIVAPLLKNAVAVSFVNTFTATMMSVGAIIFIISPASKVATVELFDLLNSGNYNDAAVLAVILTVITVVVNIAGLEFLGSKG